MKIQKILKSQLQLNLKSIDLSLNRIKRLLKDLDNPEKKLTNVIQVTGTNAKHSVCTSIREIFETAGYSVNMNISPSIRKFNERYYLKGKYISDDDLYNLLIEVEKINDKQKITFHEFITACFFLVASRNKSDILIQESGLFFRLDASNVFEKNIASIITPIGIDHIDFTKKGTIDEIVYEKCSHLLNNSKIIVAEQKNSTLNKIKKNIKKNSSTKIFFGEDYKYKKNASGFTYIDKMGKIKLPQPSLLGDFQLSNISTAINAARNLQQYKISDLHIKKAVKKIRSEGRLQFIKHGKLRKYVSKKNLLLLDGGHNPMSAIAVNKYLKSFRKKKEIIMVLGMMEKKQHKKFIKVFKNNISSVVTVDIPNQKNFVKKEMLSKIALSCGIPSKPEASIKSALKNIGKKNKNAIIFLTGSLYLVGETLNLN